MSELTEAAATAQEFSWEMYLEGCRLVSAYQRLDKDGLRVMIRSMYHNGWNLKDLHLRLQDLTKIAGHIESDFDDRRYEDVNDMTVFSLQEKLENYYKTCHKIAMLMRGVNGQLNQLGHPNPILSFVSGRLLNDIHFLKLDIEHLTHTKLTW